MKSITIHGLEDPLDSIIRQRAKSNKTSLNKTIKQLLAEALGLKPELNENHREDFLDLFGVWSKADMIEFTNNIKDFERIDPEDWA
ncbi:MAG: antitoxin [Proteobacteria bacterium]|nr:antitoxin [Pseudomonadota bacterium]MBU1709941.1 antitoxin [Pseudomonadota bacterium]